MAAFADTAFAKDTAFSSTAFSFVVATGPEGGISGYLKPRKMYKGGNLMVQPMDKATRRAEEIMVGWRDDDEAMIVIQIIEHFL